VVVQAIWVTHGRATPDDPTSWQVEHLVSMLLPGIVLIIGGVSLAGGEAGGLYWVLAAILLAFVSASINACAARRDQALGHARSANPGRGLRVLRWQ
jgi:hypothetical protein